MAFSILVLLAACGPKNDFIPGTTVDRSDANQQLIDRVEQYREAVEKQDVKALLLMAAPEYWEDGGTSSGADDYGFKKLREVLRKQFQDASDIRYSMKYVGIKRRGPRAYVDVLIDASYSITDARGEEVRRSMRDQNQLVLRWDKRKERWLFLSGF